MSKFEHRQLGELLNRAYELEGLLLLALSRQDSDNKIQSLIVSKIFNMADTAAEWDPDGLDHYREESSDEADGASYSLEESEEEESAVVEEHIAAEEKPETVPAFESIAADASAAADDEALADATEEEAEEEAEENPEMNPQAPLEIERDENADDTLADVSLGPVKECTPLDYDLPAKEAAVERESIAQRLSAAAKPLDAEIIDGVAGAIVAEAIPAKEPVMKSVARDKAEAPAEKAVDNPRKPVAGPMPRPVFSLNDRYMFTRTLFHNSKKEFDDAVRYISTLESFDEAEDYFINELEWNPDDNDVKQFSEVIHRYFNAL